VATSSEERRHGGVAAGLVEYQMRFREIISRAGDREETVTLPKKYGPFLTISREAGSGGAEVARLVGDRLGWSVLDKELVNGLADELKLEPHVLELIDETRSNWFSDTLLNLFNSKLVLQHSYVASIGSVMALAASAGEVVLVGRGGHLILPHAYGLRVRLIAPREHRAATIAEAEGVGEDEAVRRLVEIDTNRQDFIRRHFRKDVTDSSLYDLVVNTGTLGIDSSVEVILGAVASRGFRAVSSPPSAGSG
jgi:cytidylate kinase